MAKISLPGFRPNYPKSHRADVLTVVACRRGHVVVYNLVHTKNGEECLVNERTAFVLDGRIRWDCINSNGSNG